jgi:SAM domain (Sterile alpha motif)/KH domain
MPSNSAVLPVFSCCCSALLRLLKKLSPCVTAQLHASTDLLHALRVQLLQVVGWVIGKNGSTIKDLKNKTGCNMWVDQRALKLTITGPDARTVEHAAKSVEAYVAAAPIKAGAVEAAVTRSLDCPPHLLDILGDRATIARIVKETRAQVVVNKKMARAIVRGGPHAVQLACAKVQAIIVAAAAEHQYKLAMEAERRVLAGEPPQSDAESEEQNDGGGSVASFCSHSASAVGSPVCSAPTSPRSASGRSWSLFSGPSAFSAGAAALNASSPQASTRSNSAPTLPTAAALEQQQQQPVSAAAVSAAVSAALDPVQEDISASPAALAAAAATAKARAKAKAAAKAAGSSVCTSKSSSRAASPPRAVLGAATTGSSSASTATSATAAPIATTPADLAELLSDLKLTKYNAAFEENEVDIDAVKLMSEADFSELGVPKGPRLKIMNAVKTANGASLQGSTTSSQRGASSAASSPHGSVVSA